MRELRIDLPEPVYDKLVKLKEEQGYGSQKWSEWIRWLTRAVDIQPTLTQRVRKGTRGLLPMWMNNFANNLPLIRSTTGSIKGLVSSEPTDKPSIVIGRGPSLFRHKHLDRLKNSPFTGDIVATDGILIDLLKNSIIPDYVLSVDGSEVVTKWFDHPLVRKHGKEIKAVICINVHPKVVQLIQRSKMPIYWFLPAHDDGQSEESFTRSISFMTVSRIRKEPLLSLECMGCVGSTSIVFAWAILKSKIICLIGFDYGYPADMPLDETYYWKTTCERMGALDASTMYETFYHPFFKTKAKVDAAFSSYRESILSALLFKPHYARVVNATEGGTLYFPEFLEYAYFKDWLENEASNHCS